MADSGSAAGGSSALGDGDGSSGWWQWTWQKDKPAGSLNDYRPHLTNFVGVRDLRIGGGLRLQNSANHHIWVQDSVGVRIGGGGLSIHAPAIQGGGLPGVGEGKGACPPCKGSPNTDGMNIAGGDDTLIENVEVHNNDDCVR